MKTKKYQIAAFILILFCLTQAATAQVPPYVPTSGLVSWWGFNGNANDESGNSNNGIVTGAVLTDDRYSNSNAAYLFNSPVTEIDCGNDASLDLNECTYSAWVLLTSYATGSYQTIVAKWDSDTTCDFSLSLDGGILHSFFVSNIFPPQYVDMPCTTSLQLNQWYHIVATHSYANGLRTYINGVLDASNNTSFNVNPLIVNDHFRIGSQGSFSPYPMQNGKIDDVGVWNRELNLAEITDLFNSSTSIGEFSGDYGIKLMPNPFYAQTILHTEKSFNDATLKIYNSLGEEVRIMDNPSGQTIIIDRDNLASGLYYLQLTQGGETIASEKLVISDMP